MFSQQSMADPSFPRSNLKRYHEDEHCGDHRDKRIHALPLRTSPTSRRYFASSGAPQSQPTSKDGCLQPQSITPPFSEPAIATTTFEASDMDMDMSSDYDSGGIDTASSDHLEPGAFHPDVQTSGINSRMPTPIQPTFASQVRGSNWGGAAGNMMHSGYQPSTAYSLGEAQVDGQAFPSHHSVPRSLDQVAINNWNSAHDRSLPSPISEGGLEDAELGRTPGAPTDDSMAMDTEAPQTPSPKKGHTRSRHTVNNWTQQPGMKKSFSIGYRSDCEKCRNKVPGHFNHIIVS